MIPHTFEDVLIHVMNILLDRTTLWPDPVFHLANGDIADCFLDSEWHIQVSIYDSIKDYEEGNQSDGGGICPLWDDEEYESSWQDPKYIDNIREAWDPAKLMQCITDKALFVWELIIS